MPKNIILLSPARTTAEDFVESTGDRAYRRIPEHKDPIALQVRGDRNGYRWYITASEIVEKSGFLEDYTTNEDLDVEFRKAASALHLLVLDFDLFEPARDAIVSFLSGRVERSSQYWIDTDYGWVIRGDKLLSAISEDKEWTWMRDG
jgi:hypothetical protein